jgi:uncharacterized membrane protein
MAKSEGIEPMRPERFLSLDICRGFAIFVMIEAHISLIFLSSTLNTLSDIVAAPFFILISGVAFELFVVSRIRREKSKSQIFLESLSRSIVLFAITLLPYAIASIVMPPTFPWIGILKWSVFQVIAVGYIIGFFLQGRQVLKIIALALILFSSPFLSNIENLSFLTTGTFPLFPFLGFFIIGQIFSDIYTNKRIEAMSSRNLILISILPLVILIPILLISNTVFGSDTLGQIHVFLFVCGVQFFFIVLFKVIVDRAKHTLIFRSLERIGRISFSAYYLHLAIIFALAKVFSVLHFAPPPSDFFIVLMLNIVILLSITWALSFFEPKWSKYRYIFGVEWLFRKGSEILVSIVESILARKSRA